MRPAIPFTPFLLCLLALPARSGTAITPAQVAFFEGCWQGEGKFASSGREIRANVHVSATNVAGAMVYTHDDVPPARYRSTSLWANRDGTTLMSETNNSGGYRLFEATETSKDRIVFTSRGQTDDPRLSPRMERFTYELAPPDSYRMRFETMRDGKSWSLVDSIDFRRCTRANVPSPLQ